MTPLELEEITRELRQARPDMDPKVAAELDEWAAKGFPRPSERRADDARKSPRRSRAGFGWLGPALAGGFAILLVGAVVGLSQLGSGQDDSGEDSEIAIEDTGTSRGGAAAPLSVEEQSRAQDDFAGQGGAGRIQDEDAGLSLSTKQDNVGDVTDDAAAIVQNYDGVVDRQEVRSGGGREARGYIQARIPVQSFNAALAEISDLATVEARNQSLTDITKSYVSAEKRFANATDRVASLQRQLAANPGDPALTERLRIARGQLAAARSSLRSNKQQGNLANLTLSVVGEDGGWSIGDAADDAVGIFEWIGGALLVTLAVAIPVGLLAAAAWYGTRSARRRRRESVLDH